MMNDPQCRLLFLISLYMQYVIYNNSTSISLVFFSFWHIIRQEYQLAAMKRKLRKRIVWSEFHKLLSSKQFRRYFRMDKLCFYQLCQAIEKNVGQDVFLSEKNLRDGINKPQYYELNNMSKAHLDSTCRFISGEV